MGDFTKKNEKIGTCGHAYYATKEMLENEHNLDPSDGEVNYYLNPKNKCHFAFPFPKYDGKKIGEMSNFHKGDREEFTFSFETDESAHGTITHHVHPKGAQGINLFVPCPYTDEKVASRNFNKETKIFRLVGQHYFKGELLLTAECVYCKTLNVFSNEESLKLAEQLRKESEKLIKSAKNNYYHESERVRYENEATFLMEIVKRILAMVNENLNPKKEVA